MRMQLFLLLCLLLLILMQLFFWHMIKKLYKKKQIRYALLILSLLGSVFLIYRFTPFFAMYKDAMPMRGGTCFGTEQCICSADDRLLSTCFAAQAVLQKVFQGVSFKALCACFCCHAFVFRIWNRVCSPCKGASGNC